MVAKTAAKRVELKRSFPIQKRAKKTFVGTSELDKLPKNSSPVRLVKGAH